MAVLPALAALTGACVHPGYLAQAAKGQWDLIARARPISEVVKDPHAPPHLRRALSRIHEIRAFARARGLTVSRSYERYVQLSGPAVVWVVQACAPLAFEPKEWSFPIVGSVPYLGFFERHDAEEVARGLLSDGMDVSVRGATAYSTLGFFDDPVLSSMVPLRPDAMGEFANVILHESMHATVYVSDQSTFNESVASFVADRLTAEWLAETFGLEDPITRVWLRFHTRYRAGAAELRRAYETLDAVYRSDRSDEEKRREKERIMADLEQRLDRDVNNAVLIGFKTYETGSEAFERLFDACGRSWPRFLGAVRSADGKAFSGPQAEAFDEVVDDLARARCGL